MVPRARVPTVGTLARGTILRPRIRAQNAVLDFAVFGGTRSTDFAVRGACFWTRKRSSRTYDAQFESHSLVNAEATEFGTEGRARPGMHSNSDSSRKLNLCAEGVECTSPCPMVIYATLAQCLLQFRRGLQDIVTANGMGPDAISPRQCRSQLPAIRTSLLHNRATERAVPPRGTHARECSCPITCKMARRVGHLGDQHLDGTVPCTSCTAAAGRELGWGSGPAVLVSIVYVKKRLRGSWVNWIPWSQLGGLGWDCSRHTPNMEELDPCTGCTYNYDGGGTGSG